MARSGRSRWNLLRERRAMPRGRRAAEKPAGSLQCMPHNSIYIMGDHVNLSDELVDQLLENYEKPEDLLGENGLLKNLTKRLLERALAGEMTHHLGYEKHAPEGKNSGNSRNGHSKKTLNTDSGQIEVKVPRDRTGSFQPQIVKKGQTRFDGFDDKILSLYARGLTTREIQGHLEEIYGIEVSPTLISNVTDAVKDEVAQWQNRPLDSVYPVVYMDAMRVKVRSSGTVINKAVYFVLGINLEGHKDLLGMWIQDNEGAKFWAKILTELRNRGVQDILIACVDGLTGFPQAIASVFPDTKVQLCLVHMVRNSLNYVPWRDRKSVATGLRKVYTAVNLEMAEAELEQFAENWDQHYPMISRSWRRNWPDLITFLDYPPEIRRILYTTNPMESVNAAVRKVTKNRAIFPHDEALKKMFYLAIRNIQKKWTMPIRNWKAALNRFAIEFGDRIPTF